MRNTGWLIGAGPMAIEYTKVLKGLNACFITVGRSAESAETFSEKTGCKVIMGGLATFLVTNPRIPDYAIVATGIESLSGTTIELLRYGCKNILCEKPGGLNKQQIKEVAKEAERKQAQVLLAYNRRFYSSVLKAKEIIEKDGGISSFHFEFTEWGHVIEPLKKGEGVKDHWFLGNSTHVVDLAFFLGGKPREIQCFTTGGLSWHPSASNFCGAGISETGALFSYQANWDAPGRWAIEVLTKNHRLYFKPIEKLQVQNKGSVQVEQVEINDAADRDYKPGLFRQTQAFLKGQTQSFINIHQQLKLMPVYNRIANYSS